MMRSVRLPRSAALVQAGAREIFDGRHVENDLNVLTSVDDIPESLKGLQNPLLLTECAIDDGGDNHRVSVLKFDEFVLSDR